MASLKKPITCVCGSTKIHKEKGPERWVCGSCDKTIVSRSYRPDGTKCRECGAKRGSKPFKKGKNLCIDCNAELMRRWKQDNEEHLKKYRGTPEFKKKRQRSVRRSVQKSHDSYIRHLMYHLTKQSNFVKRHDNWKQRLPRQHSLSFPVQTDFDYLWSLWQKQLGLCALSKLPMTHRFNDLCSISVDRVDSNFGYIPGNVQLVCKWVNLAKGVHSNDEFLDILNKLRTDIHNRH